MADPTSVPDLRLWLKADAGVTGTTNISAWANQAPGFTAESVTQGTAAAQPELIASTINGLPAIFFDGVDGHFVMAGALLDIFRNIGGGTAFVVARNDEPASTDTATETRNVAVWSSGGSVNLARATFGTTKPNAAPQNENMRAGGRRLDGDAFDSTFSAVDSWPRATPKISTGAWDWANAALRGYLNGALTLEDLAFQTAGLTSDTASLAATIGTHSNATGEFFYGIICEILIYRRLLTAIQRSTVHSYLQDRFAIPVDDYTASLAMTSYRPTSTLAAGGWTTTESGLHVALSDQSDLTIITGAGV